MCVKVVRTEKSNLIAINKRINAEFKNNQLFYVMKAELEELESCIISEITLLIHYLMHYNV